MYAAARNRLAIAIDTLGWRPWRGLGKSNFGLRQGGGECVEGLGDVEWVLVVFVWVQLAQPGRTPTCLSLGGVE